MADWHLADLDNALTAAGWQVVARHPGDERKVSALWEIQRSTRDPSLVIEFQGLDDMQCLPLSQSYACQVQGFSKQSLYFGKKGNRWKEQVADFVAAMGVEGQEE